MILTVVILFYFLLFEKLIDCFENSVKKIDTAQKDVKLAINNFHPLKYSVLVSDF